MTKRGILSTSSLAATLWSLEEARLNGVRKNDPHAKRALAWIAGRFREPGSYRGVLFAPTAQDLAKRHALPTNEGAMGKGGVMHVLGEEAVRALTIWGHKKGWDPEATLLAIRDRFDSGLVHAKPDPGMCCCAICSVSRWRALAAAKPKGWEDILADGLRKLAATPLATGGRWKRFPFYYTLLGLSEIPLGEVESERKRILPAAESVLPKIKGNGQAVRFRRRALEWAAG